MGTSKWLVFFSWVCHTIYKTRSRSQRMETNCLSYNDSDDCHMWQLLSHAFPSPHELRSFFINLSHIHTSSNRGSLWTSYYKPPFLLNCTLLIIILLFITGQETRVQQVLTQWSQEFNVHHLTHWCHLHAQCKNKQMLSSTVCDTLANKQHFVLFLMTFTHTSYLLNSHALLFVPPPHPNSPATIAHVMQPKNLHFKFKLPHHGCLQGLHPRTYHFAKLDEIYKPGPYPYPCDPCPRLDWPAQSNTHKC